MEIELPESDYYCSQHPDMISTLYCFDCKTANCELCRTILHAHHKVCPLNGSKDYAELTQLQKKIIETEEKLKSLNVQDNPAIQEKPKSWNAKDNYQREESECTQSPRMEEYQKGVIDENFYIQCVKFVRGAQNIKSPVADISVIL